MNSKVVTVRHKNKITSKALYNVTFDSNEGGRMTGALIKNTFGKGKIQS